MKTLEQLKQVKIAGIKELQDGFLEDKEKAYEEFENRSCADWDERMIERHHSFREAYGMGIDFIIPHAKAEAYREVIALVRADGGKDHATKYGIDWRDTSSEEVALWLESKFLPPEPTEPGGGGK